MKDVRRVATLVSRAFYFALYELVASRLPNRPRILRRFRAVCVHGYAHDVSLRANINRRARISHRVSIGPRAGVGAGSVLSGDVTIEADVTMGPNCTFITGDHPVPDDFQPFSSKRPTHSPIRVGKDAFIGAHVIVLPGVTIGQGAAVGAGAVVALSRAASEVH